MRLPVEKAELVLHLLTEGCAVRAIERITWVEKRTILRLLVQVGDGCERLLPELVKGVAVEDVQADEVWGYVRSKEGTKTRKNIQDPEAGDAYCWIGLERHSKLVLAWHLGRRATAERFQLTTDGFNAYPDAVEYNFGARVDYAMLVKEFGSEGGEEPRRYAPPRLIGAEKITVAGVPDKDRICTSHVERANWTLRGHLRPDDPAVERVQPQAGQPAGGPSALLHVLQLSQVPQEHQDDSGDGGRPGAAAVERRRPAEGGAGRGRGLTNSRQGYTVGGVPKEGRWVARGAVSAAGFGADQNGGSSPSTPLSQEHEFRRQSACS
jgi:hypothetical protein